MKELLPYSKELKPYSRELRKQMTAPEHLLWRRIRRKQICGVQFYTQKPIGPYILDFYSKAPRLCIELDGEYHFSRGQQEKDLSRDIYLRTLGIKVLRFTNVEVQEQCHRVVAKIKATIKVLLLA